jgi:hypothetical protein
MSRTSSDVAKRTLRAPRANRLFCTDKKRIRTEKTVIVNNQNSSGVLYKIADCARMKRTSVRNRRSARTVFRPRRSSQNLRAARANRVFCADEKRIRTENTVMVNTKQSAE